MEISWHVNLIKVSQKFCSGLLFCIFITCSKWQGTVGTFLRPHLPIYPFLPSISEIDLNTKVQATVRPPSKQDKIEWDPSSYKIMQPLMQATITPQAHMQSTFLTTSSSSPSSKSPKYVAQTQYFK